MKRLTKLLGALLLVLPAGAIADTGSNETTFTQSTSTSGWNVNAYAVYVSVTVYVGPASLQTGSFGSCTLTLPYNCDPWLGAGTQADPYVCRTPPVLTNCTNNGGTWVIAPGGVDYENRTDYFVPAIAPVVNAAPVPLSPWVPAGSALGAMLLVLWMTRRANAG